MPRVLWPYFSVQFCSLISPPFLLLFSCSPAPKKFCPASDPLLSSPVSGSTLILCTKNHGVGFFDFIFYFLALNKYITCISCHFGNKTLLVPNQALRPGSWHPDLAPFSPRTLGYFQRWSLLLSPYSQIIKLWLLWGNMQLSLKLAWTQEGGRKGKNVFIYLTWQISCISQSPGQKLVWLGIS